jgi:hypothetical protein
MYNWTTERVNNLTKEYNKDKKRKNKKLFVKIIKKMI